MTNILINYRRKERPEERRHLKTEINGQKEEINKERIKGRKTLKHDLSGKKKENNFIAL